MFTEIIELGSTLELPLLLYLYRLIGHITQLRTIKCQLIVIQKLYLNVAALLSNL